MSSTINQERRDSMADLITPPDDLVRDWARFQNHEDPEALWRRIATLAARWGSNQELEACVEWLGDAPVVYNDNNDLHPGTYLRDARRPKPPSLKEQAMAALIAIATGANDIREQHQDFDTIRRALEALPND